MIWCLFSGKNGESIFILLTKYFLLMMLIEFRLLIMMIFFSNKSNDFCFNIFHFEGVYSRLFFKFFS